MRFFRLPPYRARSTRRSRPWPTAVPPKARAILPGWVDPDADRAVSALYDEHYASLVRLAVLLAGDVATAEKVVQDSFVALCFSWRRLRESNAALSYLRQSVVNRSRSVLRHRTVADQNTPQAAPTVPSAEQTIAALEDSAVISALRALPARQREVLIMRHYAGLSEAQIAEVLGISKGAVKHHAVRAIASLRTALDPGEMTPIPCASFPHENRPAT
jgi:RNA polymerase sigma-70 factor (sigma-E family)